MKANLKVIAQVYENYNVGPEGFGDQPMWKAKGGHEFLIEGIDSDDIFYADSAAIEAAIQQMLDAESSIAERFEYSCYELAFDEPTKLSGEVFSKLLLQRETNLNPNI